MGLVLFIVGCIVGGLVVGFIMKNNQKKSVAVLTSMEDGAIAVSAKLAPIVEQAKEKVKSKL